MILVVEHYVLVRMVALDLLAEAGFHVIEAQDAQDALRLLNARTDVRVVLTDRDLPGEIDGIALARLINERWPTIGLLLTSSKTPPRPGELPMGACFLQKPYRPSDLVRDVRDLLAA